MAQIFYDKAAVQVREIGHEEESEVLMASDCSINFSNSISPLYSVGRKGPLGQLPSGPRVGDISFNFLTTITGTKNNSELGNVINKLASGIKNSTDSYASGVRISCAGVSGIGFLNSYSFNVTSNSISSSSASFTLFGSGDFLPVSGRLSGNANITPFDNGTAGVTTGIAHGRFTQMPDTMNTVIYDGRAASATASQTGTIYSADYSISFNHNPLYKIGQEFPTCTYYTTASESINVTEDIFDSGLTYTGIERSYVLDIKGLGGASSVGMKVPITAAKQINTTASVGLDDIIRTQKTLTAAY
tara:strand:+ start:11810 stop:12715 length:906 start_codon:yes stop_codon:yes gene_type:complete